MARESNFSKLTATCNSVIESVKPVGRQNWVSVVLIVVISKVVVAFVNFLADSGKGSVSYSIVRALELEQIHE